MAEHVFFDMLLREIEDFQKRELHFILRYKSYPVDMLQLA